MYVVISKIDHCIHIQWCIPIGLGHNDPWVESHMWPQQMWGQRSSRGQWPLVRFCKKIHCIHILWRILMGPGHSDPWVESHIRPQQIWGQRSSRGQWPLVQVFAKKVTVSTYFDVVSWDTMILGYSHTCDLNRCGVKGHLGVNDLWFKFFAKKVTVSTYFDVFSWDLDTMILG